MNAQPSYPTLALLVRHGRAFAAVLACLPLVLAIIFVLAGAPWWSLLVGAAGAPLMLVIGRSYVELVTVIVEMLLPR
jgi:hypothetical protein